MLEDTTDFNQPEEIGPWKKEKVLGSGGFGYVVLWRNKETNDMIALKEFRRDNEAMWSPKNRSRWKMEVDMMLRLHHPNVVKAFSVPYELERADLPLLAMEYCSGGDLRKIVNKPENCCGLQEIHVRRILRHVSSAINYLHSKRIIHRDLKPENIVIQDKNRNITYKLIDLGYAKELDQGSLCSSFVGTLQYVAPELFLSKKYTCTVDYWSLGLVTHEIITGLRPFLPDKAAPQWMSIINRKSASVIRAYLDEDKNVVFSSEIAPSHQICNVLKHDIEIWLQLMLEWDPEKRGKSEDTTAYSMLERFLNKKIVLIFCVEKFKLISFSVDELSSVIELKKLIEIKTGVKIDNQEILLPFGEVPLKNKGLEQFVSNMEEKERVLFLFDKSSPKLSGCGRPLLPASVEQMMHNPEQNVKRTAWTEVVFLCQQQLLLLSRLISAFQTLLLEVLKKASKSEQEIHRMAKELNKLISKRYFFQHSLEQDLQNYECRANRLTFKETVETWKRSFENLEKIDDLRQRVSILNQGWMKSHSNILKLQKLPCMKAKAPNPLEEGYNKMLSVHSDLKKRANGTSPLRNTEVVRLLHQYLKQRDVEMSNFTEHINSLLVSSQEVEQVVPEAELLLKEVIYWEERLKSSQSARQEDVWRMIDSLSRKTSTPELSLSPHTRGSCSPYRDLWSRPSEPSWSGRPSPLGMAPPLQSFDSVGESLSLAVERSTEESRRLKQENEQLVQSFQKMLDVMKSVDFLDAEGSEKLPG